MTSHVSCGSLEQQVQHRGQLPGSCAPAFLSLSFQQSYLIGWFLVGSHNLLAALAPDAECNLQKVTRRQT